MFDLKDLQNRYLNDPHFSALVKALHAMIREHGFTPSELRQALFLAQWNYEVENPKMFEVDRHGIRETRTCVACQGSGKNVDGNCPHCCGTGRMSI